MQKRNSDCLTGTIRLNRLEAGKSVSWRHQMTKSSPFQYFKTSPEIIRLAVIMYVRFPLSLRSVEDLLHGLDIDVCLETIRFWWNRFGPIFVAEILERFVVAAVCMGDRILRQIREAEIEQAMDRIRLIHNKVPKEVFLLTPVVANVTVDRIIEWRDFKRGGSNIERAIAKHGVLFLSPTDCARYMSDIWRSKQAAGTDPSRAKLMSKEPCRDILYGEFDGKSPPILVEFRPAIEAGRTARRRKALVFAPAHEARQKLEQFFPVSEFRYCELSDALEITEIDNQKATEEMSS